MVKVPRNIHRSSIKHISHAEIRRRQVEHGRPEVKLTPQESQQLPAAWNYVKNMLSQPQYRKLLGGLRFNIKGEAILGQNLHSFLESLPDLQNSSGQPDTLACMTIINFCIRALWGDRKGELKPDNQNQFVINNPKEIASKEKEAFTVFFKDVLKKGKPDLLLTPKVKNQEPHAHPAATAATPHHRAPVNVFTSKSQKSAMPQNSNTNFHGHTDIYNLEPILAQCLPEVLSDGKTAREIAKEGIKELEVLNGGEVV